MFAQVLNPASWQTSLLVAASASPFGLGFVQEQPSSTLPQYKQQPQLDQWSSGGAALIPLCDKLRALPAALTAKFAPGTLAFAQVSLAVLSCSPRPLWTTEVSCRSCGGLSTAKVASMSACHRQLGPECKQWRRSLPSPRNVPRWKVIGSVTAAIMLNRSSCSID